MVSVFEKCFIDRVASEDYHSDSSSPQKVDNFIKIETPHHTDNVPNKIDSVCYRKVYLHISNNIGLIEQRKSGRKSFDTSYTSGRSVRSDGRNCITPSRRKIIWGSNAIERINNTLFVNSPSYSANNSLSDNEKLRNSLNRSFGKECETPDSCTKLSRIYRGYKHDSPEKYSPYPKNKLIKEYSEDVYHHNRKRSSSAFNEYYKKPLDKNRNWKRNWVPSPANCSFNKEDIDQDEIVISIREQAQNYKDWINIHQPKIFLLGDSHTRFLSCILMEMLPCFLTEATVKPGAKTKYVLSSLPSIVTEMAKNDFVVIISGTNDMWNESLQEPKAVLYDAVDKYTFTNLVLCNIPNNYLEEHNSLVQENILSFNQFCEDVVNFSHNAHLVNLYNLKERNLFTRHGLHFNLAGKIRICEMISKKILDIIDTIKIAEY